MIATLLRLLGIYRLYEWWLYRQVRNGSIPQHVALILDGNRRWARSRGLPPWIGHEYGARKVEDLLKWCLELGVPILTLFVFSTENFHRPREEVENLMSIFRRYLEKLLDDENIHRNMVRVKFIGRLDLLPDDLSKLAKAIEESTKDYSSRWLNIAIAYGGRLEIVDAVKRISTKVAEGLLKPEDIDERILEEHLYTSHLPKPDPDLIIRTSGEERLSGFLLWQSAYSELCFLDVYWPEFRRIDLLRAIRTYQRRERRYGR
ncbi:di-trans,poly-cis-decaprenylcistransferase [Candidatus Bathyarchaeota archaeon]|nr:di-trans,poly-cis-decaprenylcistransferase [Candidatus Bathyarchaeota archaeon]